MEDFTKIAKFIDEGGIINYVILGILALALAISLERAWFFYFKCRVNSKKLLADLSSLIRKDKVGEARKLASRTSTPLGYILEAGIWKYEQTASDQEIKEAIEEVSLRELPKLQQRTHYLSLFANLATLFGLLGTIFGLQEAFRALDAADPSQKSKLLAQGIAVAMNTTAVGLICAMPCMIAFSWLGAKANEILEQVDETTLRLVNFLSQQRKQGSEGNPVQ